MRKEFKIQIPSPSIGMGFFCLGFFFVCLFVCFCVFFFFFFFFWCFFFRATCGTWRFQAWGGIEATSSGQSHSHSNATAHSNARSLTHWVRPVFKPSTSWKLVRFITPELWRELHGIFLICGWRWKWNWAGPCGALLGTNALLCPHFSFVEDKLHSGSSTFHAFPKTDSNSCSSGRRGFADKGGAFKRLLQQRLLGQSVPLQEICLTVSSCSSAELKPHPGERWQLQAEH